MIEAMPLILFGVLFLAFIGRLSRCVYAGWCVFYFGVFDVWSRFFQSFAPAYLGCDDELCVDCRAFVCVYGGDVREVRFG